MRKAALILAVLAALTGAAVALYLMFTGPRMREQAHIRSFQLMEPQGAPGALPIEPRPTLPGKLEAASITNPLSNTKENIEKGRIYYGYYCSFCHGVNGDGNGAVGPSYIPPAPDIRKPKQLSDGELLRAILTGPGHEPTLEQVVPAEHRWPLLLYVRSLGEGSKAGNR